jgi:hypothetical protein
MPPIVTNSLHIRGQTRSGFPHPNPGDISVTAVGRDIEPYHNCQREGKRSSISTSQNTRLANRSRPVGARCLWNEAQRGDSFFKAQQIHRPRLILTEGNNTHINPITSVCKFYSPLLPAPRLFRYALVFLQSYRYRFCYNRTQLPNLFA